MVRQSKGVRLRWWHWRKLSVGIGVVGSLGMAFLCGRYFSPPAALAAPPAAEAKPRERAPMPHVAASGDNSRRPVAYIYGTIMISREELGEYLIARDGAAKLPFLVNRRIIEHACKQRNVEVTEAEVNASLHQDLNDLKIGIKEFNNRLLKHYRKSLYEWKEDVIWPKLALSKIARDRIRAEPEDLQHAFEAYHGAKVDGRLILFKPEEKELVLNKIYAKIRDNDDEFNTMAKMQASPTLAARGGRLEHPVARHTTGDEEMEKEFFALKPGEVSTVIERKEGIVVFKCDRHIPADTRVKLEDVRAQLEKDIVERKIKMELPKVFEQMRAEASPALFITNNQDVRQDDLERAALREIAPLRSPPKGNAPNSGIPKMTMPKAN